MDQNETPPATAARRLAIIAIIIAVTAPFWEGALLGAINIHLPMAAELADNARALERLDRRTADLEQQLGAATAQLGKLQAQLADTTGRANATAERTRTLAMVELVSALRRSGGFELELAAVRAAAPDAADLKPLLDQIEPYAVSGVPSAGQVSRDFSRINARLQWTDRGYLSIAWVTRLLPWQRAAVAQPALATDSAPQLLSQAGSQIGGGDLAGAIATLQTVGGTYQEALADWLEDAKARVAADAVAQRLQDQIARPLAKAPPSKKT